VELAHGDEAGAGRSVLVAESAEEEGVVGEDEAARA
jgi:hypothetical protein